MSKKNSIEKQLDPSHNVREILKAEVIRLNDLIQAGFVGISDKMDAEVRRIDEKIDIQSKAATSLNFAETKRLDAIRSVDINAVAVASERATQQASVLANQVVASAETLRTLVASTATTVAQQLAQLSSQLSDRISALEKSSYEGIGKGRIVDPQMVELLLEMKILREANASQKGTGTGQTNMYAWILSAVIALVALASFVIPHLK